MKLPFFFFLLLFLTPLKGITQVSDTIYVEEVDTVVVKQKPIVLNKTIYTEDKKTSKINHISIATEAGVFQDFSYIDVCETCKENYAKLKSASTPMNSIQLGIRAYYLFKKISIGIDMSYRNSKKNIRLGDSINNKIIVNYIMIGPSLGYKVLSRKKWDLDIYGSVNFSTTVNQSGTTVGGPSITHRIDITSTPLYTPKNTLYHISPSLTYKVLKSIGIIFSAHYYFDNNSNVNNQQSYTEQRNTVGVALGVNYLF